LTGILQIPASGPGHYWTLAVEEHFYLLWPLGIHFINPKYLGKFIIYIILLIFILKYFMLESGYSINKFTLTRMDQLLMGAFIAFLEVKGFFKEIRNLRKIIWIGPLIFILGILTYLFQEIFPMAKEMFKYPILGLLFFMIICFLIFKDSNNVFNRVLTHPSLQYLGKISYGIYVWHVLVLNLLSSYFISEIILLDLFLSIVLTIIIAHLSYYYFEVLFLKLKDYSFKPIRQIITK
jgi:peptidoglycan/LPS O-acetylase OafA/YrhL